MSSEPLLPDYGAVYVSEQKFMDRGLSSLKVNEDEKLENEELLDPSIRELRQRGSRGRLRSSRHSPCSEPQTPNSIETSFSKLAGRLDAVSDIGGMERKGSVLDEVFTHHKSRHSITTTGTEPEFPCKLVRPVSYDKTGKQVQAGKQPHSWLFTMLNPRSNKAPAKAFKFLVTAVILVATLSFITSTVPSLSWMDPTFIKIEAYTSYLFLIEYIARVYVITESRHYRGACLGRLRFLVSGSAILDVIAFSPYFIEQIFQADLPNLTGIRVLRIFRILKTSKFSKPLLAAYRVLWFNSEILWVAFMICCLLMLVTSSVMYFLAPPNGEDDFSSIPATMYLSVMMLTGQGQPSGELPWYTKVVVMITSVFAVGMFAIPASMLTWGFEAEAERLVRQRRLKTERLVRREVRAAQRKKDGNTGPPSDGSADADSSSESLFTSEASEWDQYEKVILGQSEDGPNLLPEKQNSQDMLSQLAAERAAEPHLLSREMEAMDSLIQATRLCELCKLRDVPNLCNNGQFFDVVHAKAPFTQGEQGEDRAIVPEVRRKDNSNLPVAMEEQLRRLSKLEQSLVEVLRVLGILQKQQACIVADIQYLREASSARQ
eukprot:gb/GEZN01002244.1/.p1 GENE.gb/GEZN01002244.1/~~gb/GEZN01002244.1/.p1  ORF type:complete len:602 (-),score=76.38 gb/GEZN01002244.1/:420-2225(-)